MSNERTQCMATIDAEPGWAQRNIQMDIDTSSLSVETSSPRPHTNTHRRHTTDHKHPHTYTHTTHTQQHLHPLLIRSDGIHVGAALHPAVGLRDATNWRRRPPPRCDTLLHGMHTVRVASTQLHDDNDGGNKHRGGNHSDDEGGQGSEEVVRVRARSSGGASCVSFLSSSTSNATLHRVHFRSHARHDDGVAQ